MHPGNGTASLNVTVAGSIILHHFASWAGYKECERDKSAEAKFMVQVLWRATLVPFCPFHARLYSPALNRLEPPPACDEHAP